MGKQQGKERGKKALSRKIVIDKTFQSNFKFLGL